MEKLTNKNLPEFIHNYPTKYPNLVSITTGYRGSLYPQVKWIHINELQEHIKEI